MKLTTKLQINRLFHIFCYLLTKGRWHRIQRAKTHSLYVNNLLINCMGFNIYCCSLLVNLQTEDVDKHILS